MAFGQVEKYYVTFIKGVVIAERTGKLIKVGDVLQPSDKLIFQDEKAKLSCISPGKGRFDISAHQVKNSAGGELMAVLKSNLVKASSSHPLSSRSSMPDEQDPKIYFHSPKTENRILLIKDDVLPIASSYIRDDSNFFFLKYTLNGHILTRKIQQNEVGIQFNDALFTNGSELLIPKKVSLYYQSSESGIPKSSKLVEFLPVLATSTEIRQQIQLITKFSRTIDKKKLNNEIMAHLYDNYGKIGVEVLTDFMASK